MKKENILIKYSKFCYLVLKKFQPIILIIIFLKLYPPSKTIGSLIAIIALSAMFGLLFIKE